MGVKVIRSVEFALPRELSSGNKVVGVHHDDHGFLDRFFKCLF